MKRALLATMGTLILLVLGVLGTLWAMNHATDTYGQVKNAAQEREAALEQLREAEGRILTVRRVTAVVLR